MASALKEEELGSYRQTLQNLRARLRGDLDQMTDEALRRDNAGGTGNLSNVPLHMADLGTDNYDQEFTLGLIENEQGTLELVVEALAAWRTGTSGECVECGEPISKPRLAGDPLCTSLHWLCTEAGGRRMKADRSAGIGRLILFWSIALGGTAFDLVTKSIIFARVGPPLLARHTIVPNILELHTSQNTGALWGFRCGPAREQHIFAGLSVVAGGRDPLLPVLAGGGVEPGLDHCPGLDHGRRDGELLTIA